MARIDLGNFGTSTIEVAPQPRTEVIGEAVQGIGAQIGEVARQKAEQRFQQQAATASNNLLDHQLANQQIMQDVQDKLARGDLQPEDAQAEYQRQSSQNVLPRVDNLTPEAASAYSRGAERVQKEGGFKIDALADVARQHRFQDQFTAARDKIEKLAGAPGTTPEQTQQYIDGLKGFIPVGRAAKIPEADLSKAVQDSTDRIWLNNAILRADENHDNMAGLQQLQKDLTEKGGLYDGKLDTPKRNAVLAQVSNRMDVILNHLEHVADRREADGLRAINEYDRQIASGVTAPPWQMAQWAQRTDGTTSSPDFQEALQSEKEVQAILQRPVPEQISFIQAKQAELDRAGGTIRQQTNLAHMGLAIQHNAMSMQQQPLVWLQNRAGLDVPPLDVATLLQPGGQAALAAQVGQRVLDLKTAQAKYGPQIQNRPLLPQEADQLGSIVSSVPPEKAAQVFAGLRAIAGDDQAYAGMMQQIAPDHPVLALAGLRAVQDPKVATYIVQGESLLNASKQEKQTDGKPTVSLYVPEDKAFQQAFTDAVGTAFRGREAAAETAYQSVKAYYAGKAVHDGNLLEQKDVPDTKLLKESIDSVIGTVIDYNGKGEVLAPWGMDKPTFYNRVDNAWAVAVKKYGITMADAQRSQLGLVNADTGVEGQYEIQAGTGYLHVLVGKQLVPVLIDLNDPEAVHPTRAPFGVANPITNPVSGQPY